MLAPHRRCSRGQRHRDHHERRGHRQQGEAALERTHPGLPLRGQREREHEAAERREVGEPDQQPEPHHRQRDHRRWHERRPTSSLRAVSGARSRTASTGTVDASRIHVQAGQPSGRPSVSGSSKSTRSVARSAAPQRIHRQPLLGSGLRQHLCAQPPRRQSRSGRSSRTRCASRDPDVGRHQYTADDLAGGRSDSSGGAEQAERPHAVLASRASQRSSRAPAVSSARRSRPGRPGSTSRVSISGARPHNSENKVKSAMPAMKSRRRPNASPSRPPTTTSAALAIP